MPKGKFISRLRSLFTFTKREQRGILWLLPLLAIAAVIVFYANCPSFETNFPEVLTDNPVDNNIPLHTPSQYPKSETEAPTTGLFTFDPNTASLQDLCALGIEARTAAGIIKYRERGKVFEIPEDFASCYGITIEKYTELEPYIAIGDEYRLKNRSGKRSGNSATTNPGNVTRTAVLFEFDPNKLDSAGFVALGFTPRQAISIVSYRESMGGFRNIDDFGKSYVVGAERLQELRPYIIMETPGNTTDHFAEKSTRLQKQFPIELNTADSTALRSISGIGEVLVVRILEYRARLGGFARIEQLAEIKGMSEANYERIREQIWIDSCEIQKIDINFATHKTLLEQLGNHPYIKAATLRKLLKQRQMKGGWSTTEDMVRQHIITQEEAQKLAPYLVFKPINN